MLGNGWYRGIWPGASNKDIYGKQLGVLLQLQIQYEDGSIENVVSDESWKCSTGAVLTSEIYDGESIDGRLEKKGWRIARLDDATWSA